MLGAIEGILLFLILVALCVINVPVKNADILYRRAKMDLFAKVRLLENQKITADAVAVPLTEEELELLIDRLRDVVTSDKQALNTYKKLAKKLEALEKYSKE